MKNILVTGASGHLGSAVIGTLLTKMPASAISVLGRTEEKRLALAAKGFNAHLGDYDDIASLERAMNAVDTVLLISAGDEGDRMQQHRNVVDAAKKAGVERIAYTSRALRDRTTLVNQLMQEHFDTEDYIAASGLAHTIFRNALYMDVLPLFVGKQVFEKGIAQPAGDGKVAYALRKEMGEAMANLLLAGEAGDHTYTFTGSEVYSFHDVAAVLTTLSGMSVTYTAIEPPAFEAMLKQRGMPDAVIQKINAFNIDIRNGQESGVCDDLERSLGRKPTALREGLKELFGL
jgi:NAD(P)H dehydrogenase (quinone)